MSDIKADEIDVVDLDTEEAFEAINEYNSCVTMIREATKRKEAAKFIILDKMGSSKLGFCGPVKIQNVEQVKETIDAKRLKEDYPEIYDQYVKQTIFSKMTVTTVKG